MAEKVKLLIVDYRTHHAQRALCALRAAGLQSLAKRIETRPELEFHLEYFQPDVVLSETSLPTMTGLEALQVVQERTPNTPVIFYTSAVDEAWADAAIKHGAADVVPKEPADRLVFAVNRARVLVNLQVVRGKIDAVCH